MKHLLLFLLFCSSSWAFAQSKPLYEVADFQVLNLNKKEKSAKFTLNFEDFKKSFEQPNHDMLYQTLYPSEKSKDESRVAPLAVWKTKNYIVVFYTSFFIMQKTYPKYNIHLQVFYLKNGSFVPSEASYDNIVRQGSLEDFQNFSIELQNEDKNKIVFATIANSSKKYINTYTISEKGKVEQFLKTK